MAESARETVRRVVSPDVAVGTCSTGELEGQTTSAPELDALSPSATSKRRADLAIGRIAARRALREIGIKGGSIPTGADRRPLWPGGVVGSISHSGGLGVAVVANRPSLAGIGVDVEFLRQPLPPAVERFALTPEERRWTAAAGGGYWSTAIFCAKEAAYKAIPEARAHRLDFQDIAFRRAAAGTLAGVLRSTAIRGPIRARYLKTPLLMLTFVEIETRQLSLT